VSTPEPAPASAPRGHPSSSRRKILLIEGEEDQAAYWNLLFASLGFEVCRATTLAAAESMLATAPSIISCSSWLADGSGVEFLRHLRRRPELALTYLVLLTGIVGHDEIIASLRGGANDCLDISATYGEVRARLELAERVISLTEVLHQKNAELSDALQLIQSELRSASVLQAAMLPKPLDCGRFQFRSLYRPSDMLGGDMLGLASIDDSHVAFGLVDVVGHGTASALISCGLIREMMDRILALSAEPVTTAHADCGRRAIEELNRRYCQLSIPGIYFTALAGVLDLRCATLSYCQAGHPNLIVFDPVRGWLELEDSGYPVGLFEAADYSQRRLQLLPGQVVVAVSDGLMRPQESDPSGSRALLQSLPQSPRSAQEVVAHLQGFAAQTSGAERDDQSAMIICDSLSAG